MNREKMTGTTGSLSLFLLARLFLTVESQTDPVLPPQNLSLLWIEDFKPMLTWILPQHSWTNCTYVVKPNNDREKIVASPPWIASLLYEKGFQKLSVQTVCGERRSNSTYLSFPEMVRNVKGYWYSEENASVFWETAVPRTDVGFFYRLIKQDGSVSKRDPRPPLRECSSYSFTEGVRTGCELQVHLKESIRILFNGTENKKLFRKTVQITPLNDFTVKLPPLEWTVEKTGNKFNISWITPRTRDQLKEFVLNYTECETSMSKPITKDKTSTELTVVPHCPYRMTMQAVYADKKIHIWTPGSEKKYFDAETDPNALLYAVVLIPLMFAGLTALTFVCCRKHIGKKNRIFLKVPQPRDFLTDISDNNKSTACNLFYPAEEEKCRISLVLEPEIS